VDRVSRLLGREVICFQFPLLGSTLPTHQLPLETPLLSIPFVGFLLLSVDRFWIPLWSFNSLCWVHLKRCDFNEACTRRLSIPFVGFSCVEFSMITGGTHSFQFPLLGSSWKNYY